MLRLILLRHAKSDWNDIGLSDIDRPLNDRGRRAAGRMATHFVERGLVPQRILCSTARRTRETLGYLVEAFDQPLAIEVISDLYTFAGDDYVRMIQKWGGTGSPLMVIGHNPATEETARQLVGDDPDDLMPRLETKFPTAAAAVIDLPALDWADIAPGTGRLVSFDCPRDLVA